jgi:hypothetical protein
MAPSLVSRFPSMSGSEFLGGRVRRISMRSIRCGEFGGRMKQLMSETR